MAVNEINTVEECERLFVHICNSVSVFDNNQLKQVMMGRVQSSSSEFTVKGKLCGYRMLQVLSYD